MYRAAALGWTSSGATSTIWAAMFNIQRPRSGQHHSYSVALDSGHSRRSGFAGGKEIYIASLVSIIETVQSARENLSCVAGRTELFKHRADYLPIIRLHDLFGIEPDSRDIADGLLVVLEADGRRVAMLVDELLAQQQVVIKSLETNFKQVPGLAGATIHGDGTVALILDVPGLIRTFLERQSAQIGRAA